MMLSFALQILYARSSEQLIKSYLYRLGTNLLHFDSNPGFVGVPNVLMASQNLHYACGITPKQVASGGTHLRLQRLGLHSSEKTSQRWQAVGDTVAI